jgi:hypothetical protein
MNETTPEQQTKELAPVEVQTLAPGLETKEAMSAALDQFFEVRKIFVDRIMSEFIPGVDFQCIHRKVGPKGNKRYCPNSRNLEMKKCPECGAKATLVKPGAEKAHKIHKSTPSWEPAPEMKLMMFGEEPGAIVMKCIITSNVNGEILAEGYGARSAKDEYGNTDINKAIKMCKKSALIDAALGLGGMSEMFTQDLDDMQKEEDKPENRLQKGQAMSRQPPSNEEMMDAARQGQSGTTVYDDLSAQIKDCEQTSDLDTVGANIKGAYESGDINSKERELLKGEWLAKKARIQA